MELPKELQPTSKEKIKLPARWFVEIRKANPIFKPWKGETVGDTYGNKMVLNFYGKPEFAELGILRLMEYSGWQGVWVDTYGNVFRTQYWPKNKVKLPPKQANFLKRIQEKVGSPGGCFDVFCWKGNQVIFIESKYRGKDKIQDTQKKWLQVANLKFGIPFESFLIVEWSVPE
ncbi:MAG: hypothetical protein ABSB84_15055 [Verrucomicrobiota bacterium]|jgi:hypothetical protein